MNVVEDLNSYFGRIAILSHAIDFLFFGFVNLTLTQ